MAQPIMRFMCGVWGLATRHTVRQPPIATVNATVGSTLLVCAPHAQVLAEPRDGCEQAANPAALAGAVAVVVRGGCSFVAKTLNMQAAGGGPGGCSAQTWKGCVHCACVPVVHRSAVS